MIITTEKVRNILIGLSLMLIVAALAVPPPAAAGQDASKPQPPADATGKGASSNVVYGSDADYRIGGGDVIEVRVEDAPELSRTFRVNVNGTFLMPYLGRVMAGNKTVEELETFITGGLRGRYLKEPRVTVTVKQYTSRTFFIQGAIRSPGAYQIEGRPSLLKLITIAGGLGENFGTYAFIIRELKQDGPDRPAEATAAAQEPPQTQPGDKGPALKEDGSYEILKVNINGLLRGRLDTNVSVEPGDIITIPPADVFFVGGEVNAPGSFQLKDGTTLRQAISMAQGTTFKAALGDGIIFRDDTVNGKRQEIKVDIGSVMRGKKEDIPILANDIVIVPNSRLKSIGGALLSAMGMSAARAPERVILR